MPESLRMQALGAHASGREQTLLAVADEMIE
jgi:hypothetical protein